MHCFEETHYSSFNNPFFVLFIYQIILLNDLDTQRNIKNHYGMDLMEMK